MAKYPPFVNAYGKIPELFQEIKKAAVPPKFTQDFVATILGLKSSSFRAMIPLLKNLGFLDNSNVPTQAYKDFRDDAMAGKVMADRMKEAYDDLFKAHEYANKLNREQLTSKLKTLLGASDDDINLKAVVGTFTELCKLADFDGAHVKHKPKEEKHSDAVEKKIEQPKESQFQQFHTQMNGNGKTSFGISYTINLNLPATTEIEVYNSIFKALKEHLLNE